MTAIVDWSQNLDHLHFASSAIDVKFDPAQVTWLASLDESGNLLGVVVYSRFSECNCEMSVVAASPKFLTRKALKAFFGYPFHQLKLPRVTAVVATNNKRAFNFNQRLGFVVEGYLRKWFADADGIVLGMLKDECRWL